MSDVLDQALTYAARSWPVFPCLPGQKVPATEHGFHDASTDPDQIRAWWHRIPTANIGIATGAPGPDVLDVDVKRVDGMATLARLNRAGLVAGATTLIGTPSGGCHLYYPGTSEGCHAVHRHGLDLKATGGYVVAPPSTVDGRPYRLIEERAEGHPLRWGPVATFLNPPRPRPATTPAHSPAERIDGLVRYVARLAEGNRNNGLYWAACRAVENGLDPAPLIDAATVAGLTEHEARQTVASAQRTGAVGVTR